MSDNNAETQKNLLEELRDIAQRRKLEKLGDKKSFTFKNPSNEALIVGEIGEIKTFRHKSDEKDFKYEVTIWVKRLSKRKDKIVAVISHKILEKASDIRKGNIIAIYGDVRSYYKIENGERVSHLFVLAYAIKLIEKTYCINWVHLTGYITGDISEDDVVLTFVLRIKRNAHKQDNIKTIAYLNRINNNSQKERIIEKHKNRTPIEIFGFFETNETGTMQDVRIKTFS